MKRGRPRKKKQLSETENIEDVLTEEELTEKWKEEGDEEDGQHCGRKHTAQYTGADGMATVGTGTGADRQR